MSMPVRTAVVPHLVPFTVLVFWQRIRAMMGQTQFVFLREVCIPHQPEPRRATLQKLRGVLMRSRKLIMICSERYFTRLMCMYEVASFLQHSAEHNVAAMPEAMGWCLLVFYLNYHVLAIGLCALSSVENAVSLQALRQACATGGVCFGVALAQLVYLFSLAMRLQASAQRVPAQIRQFRIENTSCLCCDLQHTHPATGSPLMCDWKQISGMLKASHGAHDDVGSRQSRHMRRFNAMVRQQAAALVRCRPSTCANRFGPFGIDCVISYLLSVVQL